MKKLLIFLNKKSLAEQIAFATDCGTTIGYLRKACSIGSKFNPELCVLIERTTYGQVTRKDLRPNDWHLIWPELAGNKPEAIESTSTRVISADDNRLVIDPVNRKGDRRHDERRSRERRQNSNGGGRRVGERRVHERRLAERRG